MSPANLGLPLTWRRIPERYGLIGSECENCKTNYFPVRKMCPKCRRKGKMREVKFSGKGKVYSYTVIYSPPTGFELDAPYAMGIIELAEGPKLTAQIVDSDPKDVKIGTPVEMIFRKIQEDGYEGLIHYGFKFKVVR
ncbi:Zn-ribbon domain-containing OB-fold protein [Candidatus Micrarchaeota archaeon]|nr:Zn-ribbon domain-containing OB-fold protein [Candidatus Micrarchaeota archaeon]